MNISVTRLGDSFCGLVEGVDVATGVSPETIQKIREFLSEYPVICFRNQKLEDEQQVKFASAFGPLLVNQYPELGGKLDGSKKMIEIGNVDEEGKLIDPDSLRGRMGAANFMWHTDGSHSDPATRYTILSARVLPTNPPDTAYASMRLAWERLPEARKAELDGLMVEHNVMVSRAKTGFMAEDFTERTRDMMPSVIHPLVRTDPISGHKALYLSSHASHIVGRPVDEGRQLLESLYQYATQPEMCYNHKWQPNDLVMWDDFATMHRATEYTSKETRFLRWTGVLDQKVA